MKKSERIKQIEKDFEEMEKIKKMREKGMTIATIAQKIGKSLYYVNSRLTENYKPKKLR